LEIVARYNKAFDDIPWITTPKLAPWLLSPSETPKHRNTETLDHRISWHLYTVLIDFEAIGKTRADVMMELRSKGVGTQVLYIPVHLQPWYRKTYGYLPGKCPVAEAYYTRALSLPLYPAMTNEEVEHVISVVRKLATL
jgi:dTDP-4-amino-4,6-dideoxygalactose transaminase